MFVIATGQAPVRAAASSGMEITATTSTLCEVALLRPLTILLLLLTITTPVMTVHRSLRMSPMHAKSSDHDSDTVRVRTSEG
eukprot:2885079-Amphidinium_carterae.1